MEERTCQKLRLAPPEGSKSSRGEKRRVVRFIDITTVEASQSEFSAIVQSLTGLNTSTSTSSSPTHDHHLSSSSCARLNCDYVDSRPLKVPKLNEQFNYDDLKGPPSHDAVGIEQQISLDSVEPMSPRSLETSFDIMSPNVPEISLDSVDTMSPPSWETSLDIMSPHYKNNVSDISLRIQSPPPVPCLNDAVGTEQQIARVIELLEWENDNPSVSVVIYGIGGSGKTTLADAVYASMNLQGWKCSKVSLLPKKGLDRRIEEKGGLDPRIEELQSQILHDLTGIKKGAKDFQSGQQQLKAIIEKEIVFIYIDNIVRIEHLEKLLPRNITSPKKIRMLITSRKRNVSAVIKQCGIKPCKFYPTESLSLEAAIHILSKRIDRDRDGDSMLSESHCQAYEIAKHCSCSPLFLQVIGDYLHEQNNESGAYDKVVDWLQGGEVFSGDNENIFDIFSIFWAYEDPTVQEAFLDICSFFHDWDWEKVACIVGKEELESLEEGDLIQRRIKVDTQSISIRALLLAAGRSKSKHNRFASVELFSCALEKEKVLHQTKGVWLKGRNNKPIHISADKLDAMSESLRVFATEGLTIVKGKCNGQFDQLRFLQVNGRVPDLPIDILQPIQLRELNILSSIQKFPKSIGQLQHLQTVVVVGRPNTSLKALPQEFCHLQSLKRFTLRWCMAFTALPAQFGSLTNLQHLDLSFCSELKELPLSFKHLLKLKYLNLQGCINLAIPPHFLGKITTLQHGNFQDCRKLEVLPIQIPWQASLRSLNLLGTRLEDLPSEMGFLINMEILEVGSPFLKSLPASLGFLANLQTLQIEGCPSLTRLPDSLRLLRHLSINAPQALKETVEQNLELHNRE